MENNKMIFVTGNTVFGPVTRGYLNIKVEAALARFRESYPNVTNPEISEIEFEDTIQINQRITRNDIIYPE